jgi:hypothetical protein
MTDNVTVIVYGPGLAKVCEPEIVPVGAVPGGQSPNMPTGCVWH